MPQPVSKGGGFVSTLRLLRAAVGDETFTRIASRLPDRTAALLAQPPLPMSLIPIVHFLDTIDAAQTELGIARASQICEDIGAKLLEEDLRGIYRALLRIVSVDFAIKRAGAMYQQYNVNAGTVAIERTGKGIITARYRDLISADAVYVRFLAGAARGVVALASGSPARVTDCKALPGNSVDVTIEYTE